MTPEIVDGILQEFQTVSDYKINRDRLELNLSEYSDDLNKTIIHHEIQTLVTKAMKEDPKINHLFNLKKLENSSFVYLKKHIVLTRKMELQAVKIVISKKKYDISEFKATYYGKEILKDFPKINKKRMLTLDEYNAIREKLLSINLELPEEIRPTATENLFNEVFGEEENE